ncbi:hypothetical protein B0A54_03448 [Friedmanniomyces endolithicus]|uniref:Major facilitator superfamily (MFS) profile domain-containing protein n=1 Tax=Friedmanniomyces endolithicus TaxID=329885 RepID=A0A4U0VAQ2_9PEZI|nr:hypothetical protein B0A54_03448 [Friedmanniomyces endolithicus]
MPTSQVSWRFPLGFQALLALGTVVFVPFLVESPRWLCLKDRHEDARAVLARLHAKPIDSPEVRETLEIIIETIAEERADGEIGWRDVFHNGRQQTFRRILLGLGVSIFQQLGGINVVAYYLPVVLERSFGFSPRMALILSAIDSMQWMFWGAMNTFLIERNLGWRFYIVFAVLNAAFLPFIWLFYVETAGLSLDEIDRVFVLKHAEGSTLTYKQATEQAKEQLEIERLEISARPEKSGVGTDHVESVA